MQRHKKISPFTILNYLLFAVIGIIMVYPFWYVVMYSFSDPAQSSLSSLYLWPQGFTVQSYIYAFSKKILFTGFFNSVFLTLMGTAVNMVLTIMLAYPLSRDTLPGRKYLSAFIVFPMLFNGGMIPTYLVIKDFNLLDNFWVMVVPFSVITYYIIVARTFFNNSIPDDLWEAAQIDGCGNLNFFFKIVLPLSKAVIAVIALWTAVGQWNSYFNALIYLRSPELQPLQLVLRNILISNQKISAMTTGAAAVEAKQMADLIKYAVIVVSSAPIMCMYPFVQKYFNQGVMLGSLKG